VGIKIRKRENEVYVAIIKPFIPIHLTSRTDKKKICQGHKHLGKSLKFLLNYKVNQIYLEL